MAKTLRDLVGAALADVEELGPEEVLRRLEAPDRGGWHLIDVREADEFAAGRLPGALHYPRGFIEVRADLEHPKRDPWLADRSRKLILYCGGGHRSALAAQALKQMGFANVVSLAGGFGGWTRLGYPVED